ncbi:RHS repeat protein [Stenotrophomonas maltophilia]|uniref:RHS repeat domain-containing protein n=1 Tax=Stenotrophomonas maltophilia TaxID=40324 RepID=UPI003876C539
MRIDTRNVAVSPRTRECAGLALLLGLTFAAQAQQAVQQPYQEYDKKLRSAEQVGALTSELFGDSVNVYDQSGYFRQTDIDLAGNNALPVRLERRLNVRPIPESGLPPLIYGGAGDWNIDVPFISGVFDSQYGWTYRGSRKVPRCSANFLPYTPPPFRIEDIWSGYTVNLPGEGARSLMGDPPASLKPASRQGENWSWTTSAMDTVSCTPMIAGLEGEGFILQTTSGIKYTFNIGTERVVGLMGSIGGDAAQARLEIYLLASRIEDRFGNSVSISYNGNGHPTSISSSDGRSITLNYAGNRLQSASANGRTWTYGYAGNSLQRVTQPDGVWWEINQLSDMRIAYENWPEDPSQGCGSPPLRDKTYTLQMKHPSGAVGTFAFQHGRNYRAGVPASYCITEARDGQISQYLALANHFDGFGLVQKTIEGPGVAPMRWTYVDKGDYQDYWTGSDRYCTTCTQSKAVRINQPDGSWIEEIYGIVYQFNEGKLLGRRTGAASGMVLESEDLTYVPDAQMPSMPFPDRYGWAFGGNDGSSALLRPLQRRQVTRDGVTMTWQANSFDRYGRPANVTRSSSQGASRTDTTSYYNDTNAWLLGQVSSQINNNTGLVEVQTSYNAQAMPTEQRRFGKLLQTLSYHADGNVASFADGRGNSTTLNSWKRGIPQSIGFADGSSMSASVDDNGWIRSVTNELGYQTSFDYDAMGRQIRKAFAQGDTVAWNPTTQIFERVDAVEHGLGAGHWRLTTNTGNRNKVTWFDAMWRPALTREQDASNPTATQRYQRFTYDHAGRTTFQSYPDSASNPSAGQWSEFDALGRVTSSSSDSELGLLTTVTAYLPGMRVRTTDARGQSSTTLHRVYDTPAYDTPVAIEHPGGVFTDIGRDVFGKTTSIRRRDASGGIALTRSYVYNPQQELCKSIEPETGAMAMGYDAAGNLAWSAAGLPQGVADNCDTSAEQASGRRVDRTYDARNRLKQLVFADASGDQAWQYNSSGLPTQVTTSNPSGKAVTNTYVYSKRGLIIGETLQQPGGVSWSMGYGYDANGALASLQYPSGLQLALAPNALGQPTRIGSYATGVGYYPNGALRAFTYGNGIAHSMAQNGRGLPARAVDAGVLDNSIVYDRNGNVASITDAIAPAKSKQMQYDALDRLTQATSASFGGDTIYRYTYDVLDNLRSAKLGGVKQHNYWYDARNRMTNVNRDDGSAIIGLDYDVQGNLAKKNGEAFRFDLGNRLRDAAGRETYAYDAHGRRVGSYSSQEGDILSFYGNDGVLRRQDNKRTMKEIEYISLGTHLIAQVEKSTGLAVPRLSGPATVETGSYTLSWGAVGQASRYELRMTANGGLSWSTLYAGSALSHALTGVPKGVRQYQVRSCDASRCSAWSASMFVRHLPIPVPGAAPVLSGPAESNGDYQLTWNETIDATFYQLEESEGGGWTRISNDILISHSFAARLPSIYSYRVRGCSEAGCGPYSDALNHRVRLSIPKSIKVQAFMFQGDAGEMVTWLGSPGAQFYEVKDVAPDGFELTYNVGDSLVKSWTYTRGQGITFGSYFVRACTALECTEWGGAVRDPAIFEGLPPDAPKEVCTRLPCPVSPKSPGVIK